MSAKNIRSIRDQLGMSQADFADVLGCSQTNVGYYERGQDLPKDKAIRLANFCRRNGWAMTLDAIYGVADVPAFPRPAPLPPLEVR